MNWPRSLLSKAFSPPTPVEGAALIIPARHPVQMWLTGCLVIFGVLQAIFGAPDTSVVNELLRSTNVLQMVVLVLGSGLCLIASYQSNRVPYDAMIYSATGFFFLGSTFAFYAVVYWVYLPYFWLTLSFWISIALAGGSFHRLGQITKQWVQLQLLKRRLK